MALGFESTQKDYFGDAISVNKIDRQYIYGRLFLNFYIPLICYFQNKIFPFSLPS